MTSVADTRTAAPGALSTLATVYRLLLRTQLSLARVLGIGTLGALSVLLGFLAGLDASPEQAFADVTSVYALGLALPLATLWLGTSVLGDLVEDRLLVYLWLKPVPRWIVPAAAVLSTATLVLPLVAAPIGVAALVAGTPEIALPAFLAATLAGLAYSGVFVAAGLWFRRAAWWGLAFVLLWENGAAHSAAGIARFTIAGWAGSVFEATSDVSAQVDAGDRSLALALIVLVAIAIAGWGIATVAVPPRRAGLTCRRRPGIR